MRRPRVTVLRLAVALAAASLAGTGIAFAATLPLTSKQLGASAQSLSKSTCNQTNAGAEKTYVDQNNPTTTNSGSISVRNRSSRQRYGFLTWSLSGCAIPRAGGADRAVLSIQVSSTTYTNHTISVYPVTSSWSASSLTWNGLGGLTIGSSASGSFQTTTGTHTLDVSGDVDDAIKTGALWGWELRDTAGANNNTATIGTVSLTLSYER